MSIQSIIKTGRKLRTQVQQTVVSCARETANEIWNTFGGEATNDDMTAIAKGIEGDDAPAPRISEWKAFVKAVPFGLDDGIRTYVADKSAPTLTRVRLFGLARALNKAGDYTRVKETVAAYIEAQNAAPSKGAGVTPMAKFENALSTIKNVQTQSRKVIEFRKELAALCEKHGVKY